MHTLEQHMLHGLLGNIDGVDDTTIRAVVAATAHTAESVIRGDGVFITRGLMLGGTREERDLVAGLDHGTGDDPELWELDGAELAAQLNERVRVITLTDILGHIYDLSRLRAPKADEHTIARVALEAARYLGELYDAGRLRFDLSPKALERVVEDWVIANLDGVANRCELPPLDLFQRQHRFRTGRRADLVCRTTSGFRDLPPGLWIVIELKAGLLLPVDVDQIAGYVDAALDELDVEGDGVLGVLLGDGIESNVQARIDELDLPVIAQNLVSVGFHQALFEEIVHLEEAPTEQR